MGDGDGGSYKGQLRWIYPPPSRILSSPINLHWPLASWVGGFSSILSDEYHSFLCTSEEICVLLSSHFPKGTVDTWDPCFSLRSLGAGMLEVFRGFPMVGSLKKENHAKSFFLK